MLYEVSLGEGKIKEICIFKVKPILAINDTRVVKQMKGVDAEASHISIMCNSGRCIYSYVGSYFGLLFQYQRWYFWVFLSDTASKTWN